MIEVYFPGSKEQVYEPETVWVCTGSILNAQEGCRSPGADRVSLPWKIKKNLGHDKPLFTDTTGSMVIEIDKKRRPGFNRLKGQR
jgi:uncharacterized protein YdeI (BOF family)